MLKIQLKHKEEIVFYDMKATWSDITHTDFMKLIDMLPERPEWFFDSFCCKYNGEEFDFEKTITLEMLPEYMKHLKDFIKPLTNIPDELLDTMTEKGIFELFGNVEHFYASLLLQTYIGFEPIESIRAILPGGSKKYRMLLDGVQIFGQEFIQKGKDAKSNAEMMDLAVMYDQKSERIRKEFFEITKNRFDALPMLAAVMTTKKYDEEKVLKSAELMKGASMQELISVFFYASSLLAKYRPVMPTSTEVISQEEVK